MFGFGVPRGGLEGGFGHGVSADLFESGPDIGGGVELLPFQHGPEILGDDVPGGFGVFGRVEGIFAGGAFAPADGAVVELEFGEDDAALGDAVHGGFERREEFEMDFAESDLLDLHGWGIWFRRKGEFTRGGGS